MLEDAPGRGERFRQRAPHPGLLRALTWKENDGRQLYSLTTIDAHVNPAPKAANITVEPGPTIFRSMASSRAIGIDADDV